MQISTQVVLSEIELKEAAADYVRANMVLAENSEISVEFVDSEAGELTAVVLVSSGGSAPAKSVKAAEKPAPAPKKDKPRREPVKAEAKEEAKAAISTGEERKAPDDEPPFEVEAPKTAPKIFPDASTSAPASLPQPDVSATAKSLFANLIKPTQ
jgi:hypothetical protein